MFRAMRNGTDWAPTLAVFGDLGNINSQSLTRIQLEAQDGIYDAVLHVGDFAYDMDSVLHAYNMFKLFFIQEEQSETCYFLWNTGKRTSWRCLHGSDSTRSRISSVHDLSRKS